jgi:hypothetical protein
MSTETPTFGQSDIVRLSDVGGKMWAGLVDWARQSMLVESSELANAVDFQIPHCVDTIEEAIALLREKRNAWLAAQEAGSRLKQKKRPRRIPTSALQPPPEAPSQSPRESVLPALLPLRGHAADFRNRRRLELPPVIRPELGRG